MLAKDMCSQNQKVGHLICLIHNNVFWTQRIFQFLRNSLFRTNEDNSPAMIEQAKQDYPDLSFRLFDANDSFQDFVYPVTRMRPASPMVRRKRDFFEWEFTKKMNAVGL